MTLQAEDKGQGEINRRGALLTSTDHPNNFLGVVIRLDEPLNSCV